jgi:hypothetical protein
MATAAPDQPQTSVSFKDRYATDSDFKAQVDESRLRRERLQVTEDINSALATASGIPGAKPKMY